MCSDLHFMITEMGDSVVLGPPEVPALERGMVMNGGDANEVECENDIQEKNELSKEGGMIDRFIHDKILFEGRINARDA